MLSLSKETGALCVANDAQPLATHAHLHTLHAITDARMRADSEHKHTIDSVITPRVCVAGSYQSIESNSHTHITHTRQQCATIEYNNLGASDRTE